MYITYACRPEVVIELVRGVVLFPQSKKARVDGSTLRCVSVNHTFPRRGEWFKSHWRRLARCTRLHVDLFPSLSFEYDPRFERSCGTGTLPLEDFPLCQRYHLHPPKVWLRGDGLHFILPQLNPIHFSQSWILPEIFPSYSSHEK